MIDLFFSAQHPRWSQAIWLNWQLALAIKYSNTRMWIFDHRSFVPYRSTLKRFSTALRSCFIAMTVTYFESALTYSHVTATSVGRTKHKSAGENARASSKLKHFGASGMTFIYRRLQRWSKKIWNDNKYLIALKEYRNELSRQNISKMWRRITWEWPVHVWQWLLGKYKISASIP